MAPVLCRMDPVATDGSHHAMPGAMWIETHEPGRCYARWSNCDGRHLVCILPDGSFWDVDSRASNCASPQETTHRCWVRRGIPPRVTAGKDGPTCAAGAGSIQGHHGWHGFLDDGWLTEQRGAHPPWPQGEVVTMPDATPTGTQTAAPAAPEVTTPAPAPEPQPEPAASEAEAWQRVQDHLAGEGHLTLTKDGLDHHWHGLAKLLHEWREHFIREHGHKETPAPEPQPSEPQ